jgi:SAM-dependent methyltransferase
MLAIAREDGWSVVGIDYSRENTARLRASGFDVRVATDLPSSGVNAGSVDCLVAKHVIEHVVDLERFLADCRTVLRPGGILAIKTPSRTSLRARLGLANWHLVNPPEHQWGFQPHCFRLLLESHGLEVRYLRNDSIVDELVCIAGVPAV